MSLIQRKENNYILFVLRLVWVNTEKPRVGLLKIFAYPAYCPSNEGHRQRNGMHKKMSGVNLLEHFSNEIRYFIWKMFELPGKPED